MYADKFLSQPKSDASYTPKEEVAASRSSRIVDPHIEASKRLMSPISALKELVSITKKKKKRKRKERKSTYLWLIFMIFIDIIFVTIIQCIMEGLGVAFQTRPQFSSNWGHRNEVCAEVSVYS